MTLFLLAAIALSLERSDLQPYRAPASTANDMQIVKDRLIEISLPAFAPGETAQTWKATDIAGWLATLEADGSFADLDYKSKNAAAWPPAIPARPRDGKP